MKKIVADRIILSEKAMKCITEHYQKNKGFGNYQFTDEYGTICHTKDRNYESLFFYTIGCVVGVVGLSLLIYIHNL